MPKLAITPGDIPVRRAVEAISSNAVAPVELIGDRIQKSLLGKCLVKCRIEDGDLGKIRAH